MQRMHVRSCLVSVIAAILTAASAYGLPVVGSIPPDSVRNGFLGYLPNQVVVQFTSDFLPNLQEDTKSKAVNSPKLDALGRQLGHAEFTQLFKGRALKSNLGSYALVKFSDAIDLDKAIALLREQSFIKSVEPDPVFAVDVIPDDPGFDQQWFHQQQDDHDLDTPEEWNDGTGNPNVLIGITDTGVLYSHPDLAANIWTNEAESQGLPGVDDDSNGYIDDIHGWDFVSSLSYAYSGEDASAEDNDPSDFNGHGTHIAGIIGAVTNNGVGVAGIAGGFSPSAGVALVPLRIGGSILNPITHQEQGVIILSAAAEAFDYARQIGVDVLNCSWGSTTLASFVTAVDNALSDGITICVAAGNDGTVPLASYNANYLATLDDAIVVAAVDSFDVKAPFSNFGPTIDVSAPGVDIYSTFSNHYTATYAYLSGTSMAAPMVTGIVGLIKSSYSAYTESEIQTIIKESADDISALNPDFSTSLGSGRVNAKSAVDYLHFIVNDRSDVYENEPNKGPDLGYAVSTSVITASPLIPDFLGNEVTLLYRVNGGPWRISSTTPFGQNSYRGYVGHQLPGSVVDFRFSARNSFGYRSSAAHTFHVLSIPDLVYSPTSFDRTLPRGDVAYDTLLISNSGPGTLQYSLSISNSSPDFGKRRQVDIASLTEKINSRVDPASVPTTFSNAFGDVIQSHPHGEASAAWTKFAQTATPDLNVAILGSEDYYDPAPLVDIQDKLLATGKFNSVSVINIAVAPLTVDDLLPFNAVLVHTNAALYDPDGFGDALADYCDAGGGVVLAGYCFFYWRDINPENPFGIGGRFASEDYRVIIRGGLFDACFSDPGCGNESLSTIYYPSHPLLAGVSSFYGGPYSDHFYIDNSDLEPGSVRIADWSSGYTFAAARRLPGTNFNRIDLNFYPVSADAFPGQWPSSTSGGLLMANALTFVSNPWVALSQNSGSLAEGEEDTITVSMYAPDTLGLFQSTITLTSNSPGEQSVDIPVTLFVPGAIVTSPVSGEQWCNGHQETISWLSYPSVTDSVRLYLSDDDGQNFTYFRTLQGSASEFNWTVASYWSENARIKVEVYDQGVGYDGVSEAFTMHANGDVNCDHQIDITDINYLIDYLTASGPAPCIEGSGDVDGDGDTDMDDVYYLVAYSFQGGPPPVCFPSKSTANLLNGLK